MLFRSNTDYCKRHGGGKRCIEPDCTKSAEGKTDFCKRHGGGKRCIEPDCTKSAIDKTDFCKRHGGGKRCIEPDCTKSAIGNTNNCYAHGGGKRCIEPDCTKSARDNTDYCVAHGGGKRCIKPDCTKSAAGKTDYCATHGGGKRCIEPDCTNSAQGNTDYCIAHGGGLRCPNCIDWVDSRSGDKKYDNYCATCFKNLFPLDPRSKKLREKSHENKVRNFLREHKPEFIHDSVIYTNHCDCTHRRRIDHRVLAGNTMLAVETDERQHKGYDKKDETGRYEDLYMIHSGKWIFIRFNPDCYRINGRRYNPNVTTRFPVLLEEINKQIARINMDENVELVEIVKLYFDA